MRILGYDVARALAIYGMILVNFKLVMAGGDGTSGGLSGILSLLEGRAAATFVLLAGVGVTLGARRAVASGDPAAIRARRIGLWKRSLCLLVVGLSYMAIWPADILHFYAFYIALGAVAITWPDRRLLTTAGLLSALFVVLAALLDYERGWNWETLAYASPWTPVALVRRIVFNGFHPVVPWAGFLLVGMWLARQDLLDRAVRRRLLGRAAIVLLVVELGSRWSVARALDRWPGQEELIRAALGTGPMPPMPWYMLAGACTAILVIVGCVGISRRLPERWLEPLVSTGQLSLTLYVAHAVVGMGLLESLGRLEGHSVGFALAYGTAFFLVGVVASTLWMRRFEQGPLEALLRRVTR